jgi:bifunctional non-homologous end joining protein LigD
MLMRSPLARDRRSPPGFILPCQPVLAAVVPPGPAWLHEIKHDGYRILARKDGETVRLWSRHGRDWSREFVAIAGALQALPVDQIVLDGEAMAHCDEGLPDFHGLRSRKQAVGACLFAFDLLMLEGIDYRTRPLVWRKERLVEVLEGDVLRVVEHLDGDAGDAMFRHACRIGLEGIVSKRRDGPYRSGRCAGWLKIKNPTYAARSKSTMRRVAAMT